MRRWLRFAFVVLFGLLITIAAAWLYVQRPWEPQYDGRPMSYWLANLSDRESAAEALIRSLWGIRKPDSQKTIQALASMGKPAVPALMEAINIDDPTVRFRAASILERMGLDANLAVPSLIRALNDKDIGCRCKAIDALASNSIRADANSVVPRLIPLLNDKNSDVRLNAVIAIGRFGSYSGDAAGHLIGLATNKDEEGFVRSYALDALVRIGPRKKVVAALIHIFEDESFNPEDIAYALAGMGTAAKAATPALVAFLKDKNPVKRSAAATALARIGRDTKTIVPELTKLLKDNDTDVQIAAVQALGSIGPPSKEAIPILKELCEENQDSGLQPFAEQALRRIQNRRGEKK